MTVWRVWVRDLRGRLRGVLVRGLPARQAVIAGVVGVVAFALVDAVLDEMLGRPAQALILVVPVATIAVLGGRRPALAVVGIATFTFSLLLPPRGSPLVHEADDAEALAAFAVVAFTVEGLVAYCVDALKRVERQRRALLRSVSHDLRTPLAAIVAAASEARDGEWLDEADRRALLDVVVEEGMRLDRLVANLLSLARIEAGAVAPRWQAVDLAELVKQSCQRLDHVAERAEVAIEVHSAPGLPLVRGDYTLLEQVVANLVENAVRHSPAGEAVTVRADAAGATGATGAGKAAGATAAAEAPASSPSGGVRVTVADRGPGVPPSAVRSIFEPFQSGANAGFGGMGLAICKAVVEAHGGTISVGERLEGGAEFTVTLPVR
jgi:two-component system sensor histidine kinase KdpD